jgi:hypothetical protein
MSHFVKNISNKHAIILKHQLAPGQSLDLEEVFKGFCQPKRVTSKGPETLPEYHEDEFGIFLEWVKQDLGNNQAIWRFSDAETEVVNPAKLPMTRKTRAQRRVEVPATAPAVKPAEKPVRRRNAKDDRSVTSKTIAWMPYEEAKSLIAEVADTRKLKAALKLVRNISGQERVRKLIEERILDLAAIGQ